MLRVHLLFLIYLLLFCFGFDYAFEVGIDDEWNRHMVLVVFKCDVVVAFGWHFNSCRVSVDAFTIVFVLGEQIFLREAVKAAVANVCVTLVSSLVIEQSVAILNPALVILCNFLCRIFCSFIIF